MIQRYHLMENGGLLPSDNGDFCDSDDVHALEHDLRMARAAALRHAAWTQLHGYCHGDRAARLLAHWASAVEDGRL